MLIFGAREPTAEQKKDGWEADSERYDRKNPCLAFWWIGQDFSHCDNCGNPCWEHPYKPGFGEYAGLRKIQTDKEALAMWRVWGEPKGITFIPPSKIRAWIGERDS